MTEIPDVGRAVHVLRRGGLVGFPTETVYGLGADATSDAALTRLYAVKGRPPDHPVIVHLADAAELDDWSGAVPDPARALAAHCWPGPLTIVVPAAARVSRLATGGLDTVDCASRTIHSRWTCCAASVVASPRRRRTASDASSPTTAGAVVRDLGADVDVVLDGGPCSVGVESTIVDCTGAEPRVLRVGGVTLEVLASLLGSVPEVGGTTTRARDARIALRPAGRRRAHDAGHTP